jgi:hypothetical protein
MPDRRISESPPATLPLVGTEPVVLVQGGETRRASHTELMGYPRAQMPDKYFCPVGRGGQRPVQPANRIAFTLFYMASPASIDRVLVRGTEAGGASGQLLDLAIYECSDECLVPKGVPVWSSGAISNNVQNANINTVVNPVLQLRRGVYFFAYNTNVTTSAIMAPNSIEYTMIAHEFALAQADWSIGSAEPLECLTLPHTFGTWPTRTGTVAEASSYGSQSLSSAGGHFMLRTQQ